MRLPDVVRFTLGLVAVSRPGFAVRLVGSRDGASVRRSVRVLGLRYLVQALGGPRLHRRWVPPVDAAVDLLHAGSMLAVARVLPQHRRLALASAGVAACFAVGDLLGEMGAAPSRGSDTTRSTKEDR